VTTQFVMSDLEKTGLLKMDFLALTTLTIIEDCLRPLNVKVALELISRKYHSMMRKR
jgi:DNA polymerase III alpha subunit